MTQLDFIEGKEKINSQKKKNEDTGFPNNIIQEKEINYLKEIRISYVGIGNL